MTLRNRRRDGPQDEQGRRDPYQKADGSRIADSGFVGLTRTSAEQRVSNLPAMLDITMSQPVERKLKQGKVGSP